MGPKDFYMTFKIDGRDVAAVYTLRPEQQARGVPAHWSLYVAVENADTAADRARGLSAKVIAEPFDVYDVGRMAVAGSPRAVYLGSLDTRPKSSDFGQVKLTKSECVESTT